MYGSVVECVWQRGGVCMAAWWCVYGSVDGVTWGRCLEWESKPGRIGSDYVWNTFKTWAGAIGLSVETGGWVEGNDGLDDGCSCVDKADDKGAWGRGRVADQKGAWSIPLEPGDGLAPGRDVWVVPRVACQGMGSLEDPWREEDVGRVLRRGGERGGGERHAQCGGSRDLGRKRRGEGRDGRRRCRCRCRCRRRCRLADSDVAHEEGVCVVGRAVGGSTGGGEGKRGAWSEGCHTPPRGGRVWRVWRGAGRGDWGGSVGRL